jgi:hypothetical protein
MAGDWLKMQKSITTDPAVIGIAARLGVTRFAVVGCLLEVWAWADTHTTDGNARGVTSALPDSLTGVTGFGAALIAAGWLVEHADGIEFPRFDRHNGQTAKRRALTQKRVAGHRYNCNAPGNARSVTPSVTKALPEKRREENKDIAASAAEPAEKKPRPRNPMFDALAEVTGADPHVNGGQIGKVSALLSKASPPYSPDEVREFAKRWRELLPWAKPSEHPRLSLGVIEKHIHTLRAAPRVSNDPPRIKRAADSPLLYPPDAPPM